MIEKFRNFLDQASEYTSFLTNVSKAFSSLPHDLIIEKLRNYGFDMSSLRVTQSHLTDGNKRVKVGNSYGVWRLLKYVVPQDSIVCPILFNIFL